MAEIKKDINENYIEEVKKALKEIKYGSLTLIIQDGKVIQIDKTEKVRL
ncbi:MAG: YezD family protein [Lachnospiraceae bacterium]|nr:YezD family protein [Lachnospiraceae bacterium]